MDSQVTNEGHLIDLIDDDWRADKLPKDEIDVPLHELPDPEADSSDATLTLKEQEQKWTDIGLTSLSELL
ncbi:anaphase-promoting complex subunit 13 [Onthophagus taurus]|uniref:anaphase-promoting complex subunit 13 n=1 Tax=Onthophagus taurus TaxID=166361 RepID=UPI0039BDE09E